MSEQKMNFESYLNQYGSLTYRNVGTSMLPLIKQGRDSFTVVKKGERRAKKWDVVLFRHRGKYVLHRVVKVYESSYDILGDNCITKEKNIPESDILAIMEEFTHKGKHIHKNNAFYQVYVWLWCKPYPIRILIKRLGHKLKGMLKHGNERKA